jgi:hypothetical protein
MAYQMTTPVFVRTCRRNLWVVRKTGVYVNGKLVQWVFRAVGDIDRRATVAAAYAEADRQRRARK